MSQALKTQLEFPDDFLRRLDIFATERAQKERPMSKAVWLQTSPEGKQLLIDFMAGGHASMSELEVNRIIKQRYEAAVGKRRAGRPNIARYRAEIIMEAVDAFLRPQDIAAKTKGR